MQEDRTAIRVSKVFGRILCYVNDTKQASTLTFTASGTGEVIKYPASSTIAHKLHRHLHNLITPWITKRYDMLFLNEHTFYFVSIDGTWSLMFDVFVCWLCGVMDEKRKSAFGQHARKTKQRIHVKKRPTSKFTTGRKLWQRTFCDMVKVRWRSLQISCWLHLETRYDIYILWKRHRTCSSIQLMTQPPFEYTLWRNLVPCSLRIPFSCTIWS